LDALANRAYARYLTSERCMADPSVETLDPAAIGSRQDDSSLYGLVDGSFTAAGRKQQLALLFVGHCGHLGAHFEHYGNRILAVLEGDRVVGVSVDEGGLQSIDAVDVDGDGRDEVVAVGGFSNTGCAEEWTVVLSFASGFAKTMASFTTYEGCCASFAPESFTEGTLRYRPATSGRPACIDERTRTRKCAPLR
jgi:hypothetical protein